MKRKLGVIALVGLLSATAAGVLAEDKKASVLLQSGIARETIQGDLKGAIEFYEKAANEAGSNNELAGQALLRLGEAQVRLGENKARAVFERIIKEFANQTDIIAEARRQLAILGAGPSPASVTERHIASMETVGGAGIGRISPDGRWIGGTDWSTGDLVFRDTATGRARRLTSTNQKFPEPTWGEDPIISPDLRQIAYLWFDDEHPDATHQLRVMPNAPGSKPTVLVSDPKQYRNVDPQGWSLDSRSVLVSIEKPVPQPVPAGRSADRGDFEIAWVSVADRSIRTIKTIEWWGSSGRGLNSAGPLSLSPDGKYIAYSAIPVQGSQESYVYVMTADGKAETVATKTAGINEQPEWTPDGKHLLFISNRSGTFDLWAIPMRDGKPAGFPVIVRKDIGRTLSLGMVAPGSYYFIRDQALVESISIVEMDPATGKIRGTAPKIADVLTGRQPSWSPDGKSISFKRTRSAGGVSVVVHDVKTDAEAVYTQAGIVGGAARWLRDSSGFFETIERGDTLSLYRVEVKGNQFKEVLTFDSQLGGTNGQLSRDDRTLYVIGRDRDHLVAYDLETRRSREILIRRSSASPAAALNSGSITSFAVSPDGRELGILFVDRAARKIVVGRVPVDGGEYRELSSIPLTTNATGISWTHDGSGLLFGKGTTGVATQIMRVPAQGGEAQFTGLEINGLSGFSLSPDGSRLAFSSNGRRSSEIVALDNVLRNLSNSK